MACGFGSGITFICPRLLQIYEFIVLYLAGLTGSEK